MDRRPADKVNGGPEEVMLLVIMMIEIWKSPVTTVLILTSYLLSLADCFFSKE